MTSNSIGSNMTHERYQRTSNRTENYWLNQIFYCLIVLQYFEESLNYLAVWLNHPIVLVQMVWRQLPACFPGSHPPPPPPPARFTCCCTYPPSHLAGEEEKMQIDHKWGKTNFMKYMLTKTCKKDVFLQTLWYQFNLKAIPTLQNIWPYVEQRPVELLLS